MAILLEFLEKWIHFILSVFFKRYSTAASLEFIVKLSQYIFETFSGRNIYSITISLGFLENIDQFISSTCSRRYSIAATCEFIFIHILLMFNLHFHFGNENSIINNVRSLGNIFIPSIGCEHIFFENSIYRR